MLEQAEPYINGVYNSYSVICVAQYSPDAKWPYPAKACFGVIMNFYDLAIYSLVSHLETLCWYLPSCFQSQGIQ